MNTKKYLLGLLPLLLALPAHAGTTSQTLPFAFDLGPNHQNLTFSKFNDMGGTLMLQSVTLSGTGSIQAKVTIENTTPDLVSNVRVSLTGLLDAAPDPAMVPNISATAILSSTTSTVTLEPAVAPMGEGADYHDFGTVMATATGFNGMLTAPGDDLSPYIGGMGSTFDVKVNGSGGWSFAGVTSASLNISDFDATGNMTVTYNYTEVPEPTVPLLSAASAGLLLMRRRRR